jgi:lipopolysaccharide/colanic/teichoic acid biosynthesis glycosyltransferase
MLLASHECLSRTFIDNSSLVCNFSFLIGAAISSCKACVPYSFYIIGNVIIVTLTVVITAILLPVVSPVVFEQNVVEFTKASEDVFKFKVFFNFVKTNT